MSNQPEAPAPNRSPQALRQQTEDQLRPPPLLSSAPTLEQLQLEFQVQQHEL